MRIRHSAPYEPRKRTHQRVFLSILFGFCTCTLILEASSCAWQSHSNHQLLLNSTVTKLVNAHSQAQQTHATPHTPEGEGIVHWTEGQSYQKLDSETKTGREAIDSFLGQWKDYSSFSASNGTVRYLRNFVDVRAAGERNSCTSLPRVLQWLTAEMSNRNDTLMVAYGGLIHMYRERDFLDNMTGKYIDDDIDFWASSNTIYNIIQLEPEIFRRFGWTVRTFLSNGFVVFLQMMASCGHSPANKAAKVVANEPALEMYVLHSEHHHKGDNVVKDLWQGTRITEANLYPPKLVSLNITGLSELLHLWVPKHSETILTCIYGQWKVPSTNHASRGTEC